MAIIRTLLDQPSAGGTPILPPDLQRQYGGGLQFPHPPADRPYVIGNFVSTLDGIVSFAIPGKAGGGEISGHDSSDRFIMGLLRASADAVMVSSGTFRATAREHAWIPQSIYPEAAELYASFRKDVLGKPRQPYTVIVSGSGVVDLGRPMFRMPEVSVRILTTGQGAERLRSARAGDLPSTEVLALDGSGGAIAPAAMLDALRAKLGVRLLLHEGGPTLYGEFIAARLVDEFFLTVAPQLAGSKLESPRPNMVWQTAFSPHTAPWLRIISVKESGDHLYLRYGLRDPVRP